MIYLGYSPKPRSSCSIHSAAIVPVHVSDGLSPVTVFCAPFHFTGQHFWCVCFEYDHFYFKPLSLKICTNEINQFYSLFFLFFFFYFDLYRFMVFSFPCFFLIFISLFYIYIYSILSKLQIFPYIYIILKIFFDCCSSPLVCHVYPTDIFCLVVSDLDVSGRKTKAAVCFFR